MPGVVEPSGKLSLATNVRGLEGRHFGGQIEELLGLPVTLDNDINLAARGEQWLGVARGVEDFVFLSVGTGLGAGLVLRGELHRGRNGAAGEVDQVAAGRAEEIDPCAAALSALTARLAADGVPTTLTPPYDVRAVFGAARAGDVLGRQVVGEAARRIALHIVSIAAVTDVALVVLGGGIGANGDLLLDPIRGLLAEWLPFPPRVEVSGLGDAAVLTGALAIGLELARERVLANRGARVGDSPSGPAERIPAVVTALPHLAPGARPHGQLELICGPMFSGKSEELMRRLRRVGYARKHAILVKPAIDDRYSVDEVVSHEGQRMAARVVRNPEAILALAAGLRRRRRRRGPVPRRLADRRLRAAGRPRHPRRDRRARPRLPPRAVRADAPPARDGGRGREAEGGLPRLRRVRAVHTAPRRRRGPRRSAARRS